MGTNPIATGLVLAALALVAYKIFGRGLGDAKFVIVVADDATIDVRGAVPGLADSEVRDFVSQLELPAGSKIWGAPGRERITLRFSDSVPENLQQRMRNYFYNAM